ncbi:aminotransferase class IV [Komagataeibacter saccharivorans]|uniref:aminotransferase class IV n=1 Tax=Komagataeibacter saccharivorans TaxID=265959 RepID=UPI0024A839ED|nr:aminotransferase class IV [Komagataeibacter saccharivorans]
MSGELFLNGRYLPPEQATVSAFDRGFLFGEGIYEVWLVVGRRLVDLDSHLSRLDRSLRETGIPVPPERAALPAILAEIITRNAITDGFIYLQITSGAGERNFTGEASTRPTLLILAQEKDALAAPALQSGIAVDLVPDIRWLRRDIKTIMLLPQVMAKKAAMAHGSQDAIFYDSTGVTEGASANVFIVTAQGDLVTRALSHELLPGCTRNRVMILAREAGLTVREETITVDALLAAPEVFLTSATSLVMPVVRIGDSTIGNGQRGATTQQLQQLYLNYIDSLPPIGG